MEPTSITRVLYLWMQVEAKRSVRREDARRASLLIAKRVRARLHRGDRDLLAFRARVAAPQQRRDRDGRSKVDQTRALAGASPQKKLAAALIDFHQQRSFLITQMRRRVRKPLG